jgi:hypothetical protein
MKRLFGILAVLALAASAFAAAERFSLSLWYGAARIHPADLNDFFGDFGRWMKDIGYSVPASGLKTFDWSGEYGAAVSIPVGDRVSIVAALGRIGSERLGNDFDAGVWNGTYTYKRNDAIHATVVRLGISYAVPFSRVLTLRPRVSADAYWAAFRDDGAQLSTWSDGIPRTDLAWTADVSAFTLGWSLGASLDIALGSPGTRNAGGTGSREPRFALALDVGWRSAKLTGFKGTYTETNGNITAAPAPFRLFSYDDFEDWIPSTYRNLNLPGAAGQGVVRNVRDTVLDLSGFSASAGVKIFF